MYYYLKGTIVEVAQDRAVIDVHDVGYEFLTIRSDDFAVGEEVTVYTLHIVREDDELFVGFRDLRSKKIFTDLISVKGIGPKTAVAALHGTTVDRFIQMIQTDDVKGLKKLPGIGPKAAAQIILDLKGSLKASLLPETPSSASPLNQEQEDAKNVLRSLGFKTKDIDEVLSRLPSVLTASDYVNEALKRLGK